MPEGPEVANIVDALRLVLTGSTVVCIERNTKSRYYQKEAWKPPKTPFKILDVSCKGKNIFFSLSGAGKCCYLYCHLVMTGKWLWKKGEHSGVVLTIKPSDKESTRKLYFDDVRKWGILIWQTKEQYEEKLRGIGPDLLAGQVTLDIWTQAITNTRIKTKMICVFLMEQKRISGIGNYLKSEILYRACIKPDRSLQDLSEKEIQTLYHVAVDTIKASYKQGGLTIRDYVTPDGKKGVFDILVYNRKDKKDVNGYIIIRSVFKNKRSTFWVKEVQK